MLRLISLAAFCSMASMRVCDPMLVALSLEYQITTGDASAVIAAFAVGVLLSLAPQAFTWLLLAASAYMGWIGFTLMRSSIVIDAVPDAERRRLWLIFSQGTITCLLNPKAYLFTLSVYPQFLRPIYGPLWTQALVMGVLASAPWIALPLIGLGYVSLIPFSWIAYRRQAAQDRQATVKSGEVVSLRAVDSGPSTQA